jgi:hypothetical protein
MHSVNDYDGRKEMFKESELQEFRPTNNFKMKLSLIILLVHFLAIPAHAEKPYFQQRVNYRIRVNLDPETAILAGSENLVYYNNSPDTLNEFFSIFIITPFSREVISINNL